MYILKKIILFFFILQSIYGDAQITPVFSEKSLATTEKYTVQIWNTENGLPQNSINDITQTNDGYIWLATFDGLVRFDGLKFQIYNTSTTSELKSNSIKKLFSDNQNGLWIITTEGALISYSNTVFKTYDLPAKVKYNSNTLAEWAQNSVLVVCDNNKIYKVSQHDIQEFKIPENIQTINSIQTKYGDQLYIASNNGLHAYLNKTWNTYFLLKGKNIFSLYKTPNADILANAQNQLYLIQTQNCESYEIPILLDVLTEYTLGFNEKKQLCVLTNNGILTAENDQIKTTTIQNGLSSNDITSVFVDKQNNFWVGTSNGGLNKLKTKLFKVLSKEDGMQGDGITSIIETKNKGIIIGNSCAGISQYVHSKFIKQSWIPDGFCIWSLLEDDTENEWLGIYGSGVFVYSKNGILKNYDKSDGLIDGVVFSIFQDSKKIVWIGTNTGLCYYKNNRFTAFDTTFKYSITQIFEDRNKQIFLATNKGLATINNDKIVLIETGDLKNVNVRYIYEDADGVLWIGTHGKGLIRLKNGETYSYSSLTTSLDNNVWSITEDLQGKFWIPSNSGMYVISKNELNDFADNNNPNLNPIYLSKEDGLKSIEFNGGFQASVLKRANGELWFPTVKGVAIVNPSDLPKVSYMPQIIIEQIKINNEIISISDTLNLSLSSNELFLSFTSPSFNNANKLRFQYKLEGENNAWINIGTSREIKIQEVPTGTHLLRVRVSNGNSNKEKIITLIKPIPFWEQTKFIFVAVLIFIAMILLITYIIINTIRKREEEKTLLHEKYTSIELKALQAQMNPHFIFNCLNSIQHFIMINDELSASKYLTKFSMLMRKYLEHSKSNQITLQEEFDLLRLYIELELLRSKYGFKFQLTIDPKIDIFNLEIPSMLFQPFVENAIHHGLFNLERKGNLIITFKLEENLIIGMIEDDGVGRKKANEQNQQIRKEHVSRGLEIIKERIQVLNSMEGLKIDVQIIDKMNINKEAEGTLVIIKIPI
ncbi:MAG: hypothetical protein A3F72_06695 [Bacteroidetes bacterium RIFCSPLOWO2_12_FULL_35_15]|nr:MAG: hypothetical protein A3F72_06695 [Bacteroidetes bacterium RIFCSPLOWO2_12_FULL_35_15]